MRVGAKERAEARDMTDAFNNLFEQSKRIAAERDALSARLAEATKDRDAYFADLLDTKTRLAEADWLLSLTWELETNQYKYPVDEYGDRLQAYIDAMNAASASGVQK